MARFLDILASATPSAMTSPKKKLIAVSGMVTVMVALAIGQRLSAMSSHVLGAVFSSDVPAALASR